MTRLPPRLAATALAVLALITGCDRIEAQRTALCQRVIAAFEDGAAVVGAVETHREPDAAGTQAITLSYRIAGHAEPQRLTCRFADAGDRRRFVGVTTPDGETLSPSRLAMLEIWLGIARSDALAAAPRGPDDAVHGPPPSALGYLLSLLVDGLVLGAIYSLVALGYAQVFSLLEIVNFAFGELYMMGAYFALAGFVLIAATGAEPGLAAALAALALAVALSLSWGWAIERGVYRPLGPRATAGTVPRLIPLVSAIGLSIFLENLVRLGQGNRSKWLPPLLGGRLTVPLDDGTVLTIGTVQLAVVGFAALVGAAAWLLSRHSSFGRQQRACAQDRVAAALLGIDVDRVISRTFMLGAALAGAAGFSALIYYGEADPAMGGLIGFKALAAAVLGGIGSLAGSMLGGLLIGLGEALWAGYFDGAYRDVAIFAVLIGVLVVRPSGLLGDPGRTSS